ncbi:hypothetical protein [Nocardioides sp. LHG3406-4]|uniref:hypothetical protein n=1 Tax=Nocardioides sp. LHG3406-4 TaxID=2804575 RepID=UPI003CE6EC2D
MAALADFTSFVQARWPVLVRSLVGAGVEVGRAEAVVAGVLARHRSGWARLARDEDADLRVWADVRAAAGLAADPGAVAPVLHDPASIEHTVEVAVSPDPFGLIDEQAARRRRAVLRRLAAAAAACVMVGCYLAWATTRTPSPDVDDEANPAPVPWYAEGRLHLAAVSVELPAVESFAPGGTGEVVFRDRRGQWHSIDGDGDVTEASAPTDSESVDAGVRSSLDGRYIVRIGTDGARVYDASRGQLIDSGLGTDVRVLDAAFADDGSVTYVLSNVVEKRPADTGVRLSETGTQVLRTCTLDPVECRDLVRVSGTSGTLRLR